MAPGADILYVGAPNNYRDLDAALNKVVDNQLADIVSNSYGYAGEALPRGYIKPLNDILSRRLPRGIGLFFSSGDSGDETGGDPGATPTPDWPASSPWVTAVGGTSLGVDAGNGRQLEFGWETTKSNLLTDPGTQHTCGRPVRTSTAPAAAPAGCSPSRPTRPAWSRTRSPRPTAGADAHRAGRLRAR